MSSTGVARQLSNSGSHGACLTMGSSQVRSSSEQEAANSRAMRTVARVVLMGVTVFPGSGGVVGRVMGGGATAVVARRGLPGMWGSGVAALVGRSPCRPGVHWSTAVQQR